MDAHVTADEMRRFAQHQGSAADVHRIARHLQSCDACRVDSPARGIVSTILDADEEHLTFEQLAAIADGDAREGEDHIARCATCARELADLRRFRESRRVPLFSLSRAKRGISRCTGSARTKRTSVHGGIPRFARDKLYRPAAAAVLIVLLGGGFLLTRIEAQRNDARLAEVALPAEVLAMQSRRLSFRGDAATRALDVIEPRDTVVMSDRPRFRWNAPEGTTSVVEVFAPDFTRVARSPSLTSHAWTPPVALRRGVTYRWQVTVGDTTIPGPPLPEALFRIVPEEQASAVRALERSVRRPSLELASAYAHAGDFDRARTELHALIGERTQTQAAEKLLRRINGVLR